MNSPGYWSGWSWPLFLTHFVVPILIVFLALLIAAGLYARSEDRRRSRRPRPPR